MTSQLRTGFCVFVTLLGGIALLVALSAGDAEGQSRGFVLATQSDAARLDPANTNDVPSMMVQTVMFEGLVGWDKDGKLMPQLAEFWTFADGGKVITFKLRKGVKFHDGETFDAAAAKANFDRWMDKANALSAAAQLQSVDRAEVVDDSTLRLVLKEVNGAILPNLAGRRAMFNSPKALAKWGKDINLHPTGTGPFEFVEWVPKDRIVVKRFEGYWGQKPFSTGSRSSRCLNRPRAWPCSRRGTPTWRRPSPSRTWSASGGTPSCRSCPWTAWTISTSP
jgi:glutathione transport system substrate-binding protein